MRGTRKTFRKKDSPTESGRMYDEKKPILAHLEELRKRILFSVLAVAILSALSYTYAERILRYLARHVESLIFISPQEAFLSYLKIALFGGLILSAPILLYNGLRFMWVALNKKEKKLFISYLFFAILLFAAGGFFACQLVLPVAMKFLLSFASDIVLPYISVSKYISFSFFLILTFAIAFDTPLIIALLTRVGLLNSTLLRKKRKYLIVLLFIIAAILTPPDVVTQLLLAFPLICLYEISIVLARISEKKTRKVQNGIGRKDGAGIYNRTKK
jgi:sec-independent protein translocase protein TatC